MATIKSYANVDEVKEIIECAEAYIEHISATIDGKTEKGFDIYSRKSPDIMFMVASDFYTSLLETVAKMLMVDIDELWTQIARTSKKQVKEFGAHNGISV